MRHDVSGIEMQHDVPAQRLNLVQHTIEHIEVRRATEMLHEVEAHTAYAATIELSEASLIDIAVHDGNATIGSAAACNSIKHGGVIRTMAARLNDDCTLNANSGMYATQVLNGRIRRRVGPVRRIREYLGWTKDVTMRVAGAGG
ncbi:hypothetical protein HMPREF9946_00825 [Acetobacteraceae bacterium AT-5844]|nr:hypothetical protein HMPREF9946_00825 [Acetobacteraceae bacterium AT-5844]